jgi:hypothetical protein
VYRVVHEEADLIGIDPRLAPHVKAALKKEPSARPSADDLLVGVIKTAMAGEPLPAAPLEGATEVLERTWVQPAPEEPKPRRWRQLAVVLAALAVIGEFIAGVVYVAHGDAKTPGNLASQSGRSHGKTKAVGGTTTTTLARTTTTTTAAQIPTADVTVPLPVVACPTSYAIEPSPAVQSLPSTRSVSVPKDLASQLSVYADEAGIMEVLAPTGWNCTASVGVDGSSEDSVTPPGEVLPDSDSLPASSTDEAIVGTQNGGCQGCANYQACPYSGGPSPRFTMHGHAASGRIGGALVVHRGEFLGPTKYRGWWQSLWR